MVVVAFLAKAVEATIPANNAITIDKALVADSKLFGLINDNVAKDIARIPTVTLIAVIVLLAFFAIPDAAINTAKTDINFVTASVALFNPDGSSKLRIEMAPVKISKAPDIFSNIVPALEAFSPAKNEAATTAANTSISFDIVSIARSSVDGSISSIILIAATTRINAPDIAKTPAPPLAAFAPAK